MQLEEFRKKKAADRAKKASSANVSETNLNEKQPIEAEHARATDTAGAGTSDGHGSAFTGSSSVALYNDNISTDYTQNSEEVSSNDMSSGSFSINNYNSFSIDQPQKHTKSQDFKRSGDLDFGASLDGNQNHGKKDNDLSAYAGGLGRLPSRTISDQSIAFHSQGSRDLGSSISSHNFPGIDVPQITEEKTYLKGYTSSNIDYSHVSVARISPQNSIGSLLHSQPSNADGSKPSSLYEGTFNTATLISSLSGHSDYSSTVLCFSDLLSEESY